MKLWFSILLVFTVTAVFAASGNGSQPWPWLEYEEWDRYHGVAAQLSEKERLLRLEKIVQPYLVEQPEFHFSWGADDRVKSLSGLSMGPGTFAAIFKRSSSVPKGFYISADPFDSSAYGTGMNVVKLPANKRHFIDLMKLVPHFKQLGYPNIVSQHFYNDLASIGIYGAIWGGENWGFIFAPIPDAVIWSSDQYFQYVIDHPQRLGESYEVESLEKARTKIYGFRCVDALTDE